MMPHNPRFSFDGDADGRLLDNCDSLEIKLYRDEEGAVSCYFELHGCVRSKDEEDDTPFMPKSDMGFVADLLERFQRVKD
jgi:hypothetical protein